MKKTLSLLSLASILLLSVSCSFILSTIKGDGNIVTKEVNIGEYDEIEVAAWSDAVINYAQSEEGPFLSITTDQNIYDIYEFELEGAKLAIRPKDEYRKSRLNPTEFTVTTRSKEIKKVDLAGSNIFNTNSPLTTDHLEISSAGSGTINLNDTVSVQKLKVSLAGSSTINGKALRVNEFRGQSAGSGKFNLAGTAEKTDFDFAGSSQVHAFDCQMSEMKCDIAGSGKIEASVSTSIKASIAGSGDVRYKGNPSITQDIAGSGSVKKVD